MARHPPLVNALNAILSLDDEQEVIFIVNDPMFVESSHLPSSVTKRKPDIVLTTLKSCKRWLNIEGSATFQQCKERVAKKCEGDVKAKGKQADVKDKRKAKVKQSEDTQKEKRDWAPVWQFLELKMHKKLKGRQAVFKTTFNIGSLTTPPSGAPAGESRSSIFMNFLVKRALKSTTLLLL